MYPRIPEFRGGKSSFLRSKIEKVENAKSQEIWDELRAKGSKKY
jgi:hypothetical protein